MVLLKGAGSAQERQPLLHAATVEKLDRQAGDRADTFAKFSESAPPDSVAALAKTGVRITRVNGPDTGFSDVTVAVPDAPFGSGPWSAVPAWTTFSVSRAFLGRASPVLRRTLEDRTRRGQDTSLILEWAACASREPAQALLYAAYGTPLTPTFANAVELRSLLQYWWAPPMSPWEASEFLPAWPDAQERCAAVVAAHLDVDNADALHTRARLCGDMETETDVVGWAGRTNAAKPWLLSLNEDVLQQVFDHPDFDMTPVQRVRTLLTWARQPGNAALAPGTREDLRQAMRWNALDDAAARALGLQSLVRAVELGLLAPDEGFAVLKRLGDAALPKPAVAPRPAEVVVQMPASVPQVVSHGWLSHFAELTWSDVPAAVQGVGAIALTVAGNAVTASSAVLGGALLQGAYHGDWRLVHNALGAAWAGGVYGALESAVGIWVLTREYDVQDREFWDRWIYLSLSSAGLGGLFGLGTAAGFGVHAATMWPFRSVTAPGSWLAAATTIGAVAGGVAGIAGKFFGMGAVFDWFDD